MHHVDSGRLIVNWREESHAAAVRHGIERPDRFMAQIAVESDDFDLDVIEQQRFGPSGGRGIAQLMTPTGNWIASMLGVGPEKFWANPARQLDGAAWLMKRLLDRYSADRYSHGAQSSWVFALAAYNAGVGNLDRWLDPADCLTPCADTIRYVARILRLSDDEVRERLLAARAGQGVEPLPPVPVSAEPAAGHSVASTTPVTPAFATTCPTRAGSGITSAAPASTAPASAATTRRIPMPSLAFDPKAPHSADGAQWTPWTCSLHTVQQALEVVGSSMSYADVFHLIVDVRQLTDADVGFRDHTGQLLAKMFRDLGYGAHAEYPVDFDRVWEDAGHEPICLSIDGHDHWMFVRSRADENTLNLSNGAPGHKGVEHTITRWQWAQIGGGAAAVHIDIPEGEDPSVIAALQSRLVELASANAELGRQIQDKERRLSAMVEGLAHVSDVIVPAIVDAPTQDARAALAEQVFTIRETKLGPRPAGVAA
jgi:hypothetical protein